MAGGCDEIAMLRSAATNGPSSTLCAWRPGNRREILHPRARVQDNGSREWVEGETKRLWLGVAFD
jgi:hypothetical protein